MANAENEEARRRYQFAFQNRGTPRNIELLAEAMRLRKEMAGSVRPVELRRIRDPPQDGRQSADGRQIPARRQVGGTRSRAQGDRRADGAEGGDLAQAGRRSQVAALGRRLLPGAAEEGALQRRPGSLAQILSDRGEHPLGDRRSRPRLYGIRFAPATVPTLAPRRALFRRLRRRDRQAQRRHLPRSRFPATASTATRRRGRCAAPRKRSRRTPISALVTNFNRAGYAATSSRRCCTSSAT